MPAAGKALSAADGIQKPQQKTRYADEKLTFPIGQDSFSLLPAGGLV
jgi:hypothetical protein